MRNLGFFQQVSVDGCRREATSWLHFTSSTDKTVFPLGTGASFTAVRDSLPATEAWATTGYGLCRYLYRAHHRRHKSRALRNGRCPLLLKCRACLSGGIFQRPLLSFSVSFIISCYSCGGGAGRKPGQDGAEIPVCVVRAAVQHQFLQWGGW